MIDLEASVTFADSLYTELNGGIAEWAIKMIEVHTDDWAKVLWGTAGDKSPTDKIAKYDARRRTEGNNFEDLWRAEAKGSEGNMDVKLWNIDPAAKYILFPTDPGAIITPKLSGAYPLRFYNASGQMFRQGLVVRGATPGQPVHLWALEEFDLDQRVSDLARNLLL